VKVKEQIPGSIPINNLKPVVFIGKTAQVNLYVHLKGGKMELLEITSFACPPKIIPQCRKPMPLSDEKKRRQAMRRFLPPFLQNCRSINEIERITRTNSTFKLL
jgi:hypothetical protein